jgi:hypothetical protein
MHGHPQAYLLFTFLNQANLEITFPSFDECRACKKPKNKVSADKNICISATLLGNGTGKVLDDLKVQGISVAPLSMWK